MALFFIVCAQLPFIVLTQQNPTGFSPSSPGPGSPLGVPQQRSAPPGAPQQPPPPGTPPQLLSPPIVVPPPLVAPPQPPPPPGAPPQPPLPRSGSPLLPLSGSGAPPPTGATATAYTGPGTPPQAPPGSSSLPPVLGPGQPPQSPGANPPPVSGVPLPGSSKPPAPAVTPQVSSPPGSGPPPAPPPGSKASPPGSGPPPAPPQGSKALPPGSGPPPAPPPGTKASPPGSSTTPSPGPCASNFTASVNHLVLSVFRELKQKNNEFFICSMSLSVAVVMSYLGAIGLSAKQIEQALALDKNKVNVTNLPDSLKAILTIVNQETTGYKFQMTNSMYLRKKYVVVPGYTNKVANFFNAQVVSVDGFHGAQNQVVIMGNSDMILTSTAFFKGVWEVPFQQELTKEENFRKLDGTSKKVNMMSLASSSFAYYDCNETLYQYIQLPYKGRNYQMMLALPRKRETNPTLTMTSELMCRLLPKMKQQMLKEVKIPKFKIDYEQDLKAPLQTIGITNLFNKGTAELKGISIDTGLFLDSVIHEAVLEVDEAGTADIRSVGPPALAPPPQPPTPSTPSPPSFIADHPFLLFIMDVRNGLVMFVGKVLEPKL